MSIAWGSLVLVVLLLPGFLFFVGALLPEQFTRDAEQRSPLGHLAGALLIAFLVHGTLFLAIGMLCGSKLPCVSIEGLLQLILADAREPKTLLASDAMIDAYGAHILTYIIGTCVVGTIVGFFYGKLVSKRKFQRLTKHPWVYDLAPDGLTYTHVLTRLQHEGNVLMYKGFLKAFGLRQDGCFSYIILRDATRLYMRLEDKTPITSASAEQKRIGSTTPEEVLDPGDGKSRRRSHSILVIEGEDVANAVFDRLAVQEQKLTTQEFSAIVADEEKKLQEHVFPIMSP